MRVAKIYESRAAKLADDEEAHITELDLAIILRRNRREVESPGTHRDRRA
jgi:hypothetical protein